MLVVLMTAMDDDQLRRRLLQQGANDYVLKPFSAQELRARVGNLVSVRTTLERNRRLSSELEKRGAQLQHLTAVLQELNAELDAFSYSVSHDLRAPLRAVDGFSNIVLSDYGDRLDAEGRGYLERVRAGATRMSALIEGLLKLSRVGRAELARSRIDLAPIARSVLDELRARYPARKVVVVVEDELWTEADPRLVRVVLENLLGNAWKFTSKKTDARIAVGREVSEGEETFFVRDDGAGFDMTYVSKMFTPFQRFHREADFEGTGVGLATVHRIVARHGGRIRAESVEGEGATFRFTLQGPTETGA
jgi:light-regulated signal transduction histidine kinase (bacteriophytochrome)